MMSPEDRKFIREEIARQVNIILSGQAGANTVQTETIDNLFPSMPSIVNRPVMHPYGIVSRAPRGTLSVTARQGEHAGNRMVIGHRDKNRPDVGSGEAALYNQFGQQIRLENGEIKIGSAAASKQAVLGPELKAFLTEFINAFISHTHVSSAPGAATSPASSVASAVAAKGGYLDNNLILSNLIKLLG